MRAVKEANTYVNKWTYPTSEAKDTARVKEFHRRMDHAFSHYFEPFCKVGCPCYTPKDTLIQFQLNGTPIQLEQAQTVEGSTYQDEQHPVDILYKKEPVSNYVYAAQDTVIDIHKNLPPGMLLQFRLIMFPLF